jgi:MYXO-CTERM domain-containing protein
MGTWVFEEDSAQHVTIYDNTGEPSSAKLRIKADAIRLVRVERGPYIDGPNLVEVGTTDGKADAPGEFNTQDGETDEGGCSSASSSPSGTHIVWLGLLGLVGLFRRRERLD